jgi:8-amino-7-oxononanoate synthase
VSSLDWLAGDLQSLHDEGLFRHRRCVAPLAGGDCDFRGRRLKNFAGNDYLNLAHDPRVIAAMQSGAEQGGSGMTASALVSGYTPWHQELEQGLARLHGQQSAILFPTGYAANLGTVAALAGPQDAVFCDRLNHACLVDGCKLSGARLRVYRHDNLDRLEQELQKSDDFRRKWLVTDSVFSMDGDVAPLQELCDLADTYSAGIILDEAHAFGILGEQGRGAAELLGVESRIAVRIGTLSKAAGALGGFVTGPQTLIDWLWNRARTQMYSTALPVPICRAAMAALEIMESEPDRRRRVVDLAASLRIQLRAQNFFVPDGIGPIVPVIVETPQKVMSAAGFLEQHGFLVAAIRPPTVPQGTSRLRITITAACQEQDLNEICSILKSWRATME